MDLFSFKKKNGEYAVILNVGSASVVLTLAKLNSNSPPQIVYSKKVPVNFLLDVNFEAFWRCAKNSIEKAFKDLHKNYIRRQTAGKKLPFKAKRALCIFASPWFVSQTRLVTVERDKPFEVSEEIFNKLFENEKKMFEKQISTGVKNQEMKEKKQDFGSVAEFIEHINIKTFLNGYYTAKPLGKRAKKMRMYVYLSMADGRVKRDVEKMFGDYFGGADLSFHTFPYAAFRVIEELLEPKKDFIFTDVGGEVSDLSLVRKGILERVITLPLGENLLVRRISSSLKTSLREAKSRFNRYWRKELSKAEEEKVREVVEAVNSNWKYTFTKVFEKALEKGPLPQDIFVVGNENIVQGVSQILSSEEFSQFSILGKPLNVHKFSAEALKAYIYDKKELNSGREDTAGLIGTIFANLCFLRENNGL